jgi:hypothetical protein
MHLILAIQHMIAGLETGKRQRSVKSQLLIPLECRAERDEDLLSDIEVLRPVPLHPHSVIFRVVHPAPEIPEPKDGTAEVV